MFGAIELVILAICLVVVARLLASASFRAVAKTLLAIPAMLLVVAVALFFFRSARHVEVRHFHAMNTYPRMEAVVSGSAARVELGESDPHGGPTPQDETVIEQPVVVVAPPSAPELPPAAALPGPVEAAAQAAVAEGSDHDPSPAPQAPGQAAAQLRSLMRTVARAMLVALDEDAPAADAAVDSPPVARTAAVAAEPPAEQVALVAASTVAVKAAEPAKDPTEPAKPRPAAKRSTPPDWIGEPAQRAGDVYQVPIEIPPKLTLEDSEKDLATAVDKAVADYVEQLIGREARGRVRLPMDYINEHVKRDEWLEWRKHEVSPSLTANMVQRHVLLGFDAAVNDHIHQVWKRSMVNDRLAGAGTMGAGILAFVAMIYGYLRFDLATRGAYRRRIRWAVASAALVAVVVAALFLA